MKNSASSLLKLLACLLCMFLFAFESEAGSIKIFKVLPHYLDLEGRHTLSPSLFERDRYQSLLRTQPEKCSTIRFDIQWRNTLRSSENLTLMVEVRPSKQGEKTISFTEKLPSRKSIWSKWCKVKIPEEMFKEIENVGAWKVTIRDGEEVLKEYPSFMWNLQPTEPTAKEPSPSEEQKEPGEIPDSSF